MELSLRRMVQVVALGACLLGETVRAQPQPFRFCGVDGTQPHAHPRALTSEPVPTLGVQELLFIRLRFADDVADPISVEEAEETLRETAQFFDRMSYGRFGITSTVSSVVFLSTTRQTYEGPLGFDRFIDDAREAAMREGFDYRDYDLEVVRHSGVPGFAGGNARLGARGAQVQAGGALLLIHEIGHNLGLSHANFWDTSGPGIARSSPPLPSNFETLPEPRTLPIHPDSRIGHDTVTGPGAVVEYGDLWDIMGTGDRDFNGLYKHHLGWLPETAITNAPAGSSLHRIHAVDGSGVEGRVRILRVPGPANSPVGHRDYTIEVPVDRNGSASSSGVLVRWVEVEGRGPTLILDGMPGTSRSNGDALLPIGRTFSDSETGVHVTALREGIDARDPRERWVDVFVVCGRSPGNRPPVTRLEVVPARVEINEPVVLSSSSTDEDGDELAWYWEFDDRTASTNGPAVTKSWTRAGHHVVRLETSDGRGGLGSDHIVVQVGDPATHRISGRVLDPEGRAVAGVRVHNGTQSVPGAGPFVDARTDSRGAYTMAGLQPGRYPISAFHPDYRITRRAPVEVGPGDVTDADFEAIPLPTVSISAPLEIPESAGFTNVLVFTRTGPVDDSLTVLFRMGGTAFSGSDYVRPMLDRVVIPAGSATTTLGFPILDDGQGEPVEFISVTVGEPVRFTRSDGRGGTFDVFYPGWELVDFEGAMHWTLTRPDYVAGEGGEVEIAILDDDEFKDHTVSVSSSDVIALEEPQVESEFVLTRAGAVDSPLTVRVSYGGSALAGADYEALPEVVEFAAGETVHVLVVRPVSDDVEESDEEVILQVLPDAAYGIAEGTATIEIRDALVFTQELELAVRDDSQVEVTLYGAPGNRLVLEGSEDLVQWVPIRTNVLFNTTFAKVILPAPATRRFYRSVK